MIGKCHEDFYQLNDTILLRQRDIIERIEYNKNTENCRKAISEDILFKNGWMMMIIASQKESHQVM